MKGPQQRFEAPLEPYDISQHDVSLKDLLLSIWRRSWIVVLVVVVFVGAGVGFTLAQPPFYETQSMLLVGQKAGETPSSLGAQVQGLGDLTVTMTEAVATRPVAAATIRKLGLSMSTDDLLSYLQAEQAPSTQLIAVSYQDPDPKRAQLITNTVGEVFSQQVAQLSGANGIRIVTWQKAALPDSPEVHPIPFLDSLLLPRPFALILDGLLGLVVGLMVGVALALVLELLDDSLRSPEEAEQVSGVPTFGVVPMSRATRSRR